MLRRLRKTLKGGEADSPNIPALLAALHADDTATRQDAMNRLYDLWADERRWKYTPAKRQDIAAALRAAGDTRVGD